MIVGIEAQPLIDIEKTGVGYFADGFIRQLIKNHPEAHFLLECFAFRDVSGAEARIKNYQAPNAEIIVRNFPRFIFRSVSSLLPLPYRWFFNRDADIRHFFNYIIPPFVKGKKVTAIHDMAIHRFPETVRAKTKYVLNRSLSKTINRADIILVDSFFTKQEVMHFYPRASEKVRIIYPGVDTGQYHAHIPVQAIARAKATYGLPDDFILYLGTLEPRKNIERLVAAYALLRQCRQNVPDLVIAGRKGWMYEGIFQQVKSYGLESNIHFTGYVSDENKPGLMAGALFFCFPSLYEGFGLPPLEAMACGTPVIASKTASLPEVVGDAGLLIDPYSVDGLFRAMEQMFLDEPLRLELKEKGIAQAAKFNWEKSGEELYELYKNLMGVY